MGPCRRVVPLLALAAACTWPNPEYDAHTGGAAGSGSPTSGASTSGPLPTTGPATTAGSGGLTDTATSDPTATSGPSSGELSASTGPDPSTSSTAADGSGSSGDPPQPPEHLQRYDPARCDKPLWCYSNPPGIFSGLPRLVKSSACFSPMTPPPYQLTRVGYHIAASFGDLSGDTRLEVYTFTGGGPGGLLYDQLLDPATALKTGYNEVPLTTPPTIDQPGFCVGLSGGRMAPEAGLGVAVDDSGLLPMEAYYAGGCNGIAWADIFQFKPNPTGRWCIDADVKAP